LPEALEHSYDIFCGGLGRVAASMFHPNTMLFAGAVLWPAQNPRL
jgi:hypothetical protein